jgi:hypothetical protein
MKTLLVLSLAFGAIATTGMLAFGEAAHAARNEAKAGEIVASCRNREATYQFHADAAGKISYVTEPEYSELKLECQPSRHRGEEAICQQMFVPGDVLVLYSDGYAIMHYNTDSDSNNDGKKAPCRGSYFE